MRISGESDRRMRKIGIEEELLLVDPDSGHVVGVSARALRAHESAVAGGQDVAPVDQELFLQQIETATGPCTTLDELRREVVRGRRAVGEAARQAGAAAVAVPTPVLATNEPDITPKPRYRRILEEYGEMTRQSLVTGMHVHVDVHGEEEGIRAMDGIRPWLPVLLALSGNSPYWQGRDTGFASWRPQLWGRWPSSGPAEPFTTPDTYHSTVARMIEWGAAVDEGMLYLDARLSASYPTIEIRVADVCTEVEDALLVASLARALVTTAAEPPGHRDTRWRSDLLRAASWRASRHGVTSSLVDPATMDLAPVRSVVASLRAYAEEALRDAGDWEWTADAFERLLAEGGGASRQRTGLEATGSLAGVMRDLVRRTEVSWDC